MGTYIGHCESCDITLEAENVIISLLQKYDVEKVSEILKFASFDLGSKESNWGQFKAKL